jgi:tetratricopeptide (TPR) repeat protein
MKTGHARIGSLIALAAAILAGCKPSDQAPDTKPSSRNAPATSAAAGVNPPSPATFQTQFQDESEFIVETIVSDLAEQAFYAKHQQLPDARHFSVRAVEKPDSPLGAPAYELKIALSPGQPDLQIALNVNGPIWSPDLYRPVIAALAGNVGWDAPKRKETEDADLLGALTNGTASAIETENQKLSKALGGSFSSSLLHEKAALLLGAFALRENSGDFYDIRSPLCRMTAHLTVAQHLAGGRPLGLNGRLAEAMLFTLMNRQVDALNKLAGLEKGDLTALEWVRTLRAYVTDDYRALDKLREPSPIENIARFRAFGRSADIDVVWWKLAESEKLTPDFVRIANADSFSVEVGHQLGSLALPLELRESAAVYELARGKKPTAKELIGALNKEPAGCFLRDGSKRASVRVIPWGLWAAFFQRHLCHAVQQNFHFLQYLWGVPDEAKKFSAGCDQTFGSLRLYPFVRRFNCTDTASYHKAVDDAFNVAVAAPQWVPVQCWNYLYYPVRFAKPHPPSSVPCSQWFKHSPPPGTVYNASPYVDDFSFEGQPDAIGRLHQLRKLAPYDRQLSYRIFLQEYSGKPTYEQAEALYREVLPYATYAMIRVAQTVRNDPKRFEELMSNAAEVDPSQCFSLAEYFREQQQDDKAAAWCEKGSRLGPDQIQASNHAGWLVDYYLKKGKTEDAQRVADWAGEVYSFAGLEAKADFLEATGKYADAFDWYAKIEERYENAGPVIGFCYRYKTKTGDSRYEGEMQKRTSALFPGGIEKARLEEFQSPPRDGVFIAQENALVRNAGLKSRDVIVAVNGIRVHSFKQYSSVREWKPDPELVLIVWQGDRYREVKASPPRHRFGVDFTDYPPE